MKRAPLSYNRTMEKTRIMIFGTFDGVHKGHLHFFKQARALSKNPYLVVSVARDINVKKIKGKSPDLKEKERLNLVEKSSLANKVVLAGISNYLPHILKEKPDIVALGYDQEAYVKELERDIKKKKLQIQIVRLKPYKEHIYKNSLLKKILI